MFFLECICLNSFIVFSRFVVSSHLDPLFVIKEKFLCSVGRELYCPRLHISFGAGTLISVDTGNRTAWAPTPDSELLIESAQGMQLHASPTVPFPAQFCFLSLRGEDPECSLISILQITAASCGSFPAFSLFQYHYHGHSSSSVGCVPASQGRAL